MNSSVNMQLSEHGNFTMILELMGMYAFLYLDPPYLRAVRRSGALYNHEMDTAGQKELLEIISRSKAKIIISGYESDLYNAALAGWYKDNTMSQTTSTEMAMETIWMNYDPPARQLNLWEDHDIEDRAN